jgi:hypothetical protein
MVLHLVYRDLVEGLEVVLQTRQLGVCTLVVVAQTAPPVSVALVAAALVEGLQQARAVQVL